jgi:hypothetical protein
MLVEPYPAPAPINPHELLDGALMPFPEHGYTVEIVGPLPMAEAMHGELKKRSVSGSAAADMRVTHVNAMSETEPNGASSVTLSRTDVDALGRAVPIIRLATTRKDRESIARMKASCVAIAEAIAQPGAELLLIEEPAPNRYLFHEAGTCAMGVGAEAPCTPWGRLRALANVWTADASVFPSAGVRHPTLTVLAHAPALRGICSDTFRVEGRFTECRAATRSTKLLGWSYRRSPSIRCMAGAWCSKPN